MDNNGTNLKESTIIRKRLGAGAGSGVKPQKSQLLIGCLFILPTIIGITIFYLWPILSTAINSFLQWGDFGGSPRFVGVDNYEMALKDPYLIKAIINTILYTFIVLLGIPIATVFASLISWPHLKGSKAFQVAFFLPFIAMPTAVALVWKMIYNGDYGILNYLLSLVHIKGPSWTSAQGFSLFSVGLVGLWSQLGFIMIILYAGLKNIPLDLYEAASLDGAGYWKQFRSITLPLLSPSIFFVFVITVINGFQLFDLLFAIMGQRNPAMEDTQSLVYLFYNASFVDGNRGYGSVIAMVILLLVGLVTLAQFKFEKRWVNYV